MKNEALAKAITEIDDELIMSAYSEAPRRRLNSKVLGMCAAACIALICCITIALRSGKPEISVYGQTVTKTAVVIEHERGSAASTRQYDRESISIPITVKANTDFTIEASHGVLELVTDDGTLTAKYSRVLNVPGSADIIWTVENTDTPCTYELFINGGEEVLELSYDETTSSWQIIKK